MKKKWLIILMFCFVAKANAGDLKTSKIKVYDTEQADNGGITNIIYKDKDGKKVRMTYYLPYCNDEVGVFEFGEELLRPGGELLEHGDPRIKEFATELKKWVDDFYGEKVFEEVLAIENPDKIYDYHVNLLKEKGIKFQKYQYIELELIAYFYEIAMGPPQRGSEDRKKWEDGNVNIKKIRTENARKEGLSEQEMEKRIEQIRLCYTSPAESARERHQKSQTK